MNRRSYLIPGILLAGMALNVGAQQSAPAAAPAPTPAPLRPIVTLATHPDWPMPKNPSDVDTVDHIVASLYDVISGPSTKPRDWERFRSLFLPDARIGAVLPDTAATKDAPAHKGDAVFLSPDTYAQQDDPYFKTHSFFERGIANRVEEFGALVHVWSSYESRNAEHDQPFTRGVNSIQIVYARGRFWIASIICDEERPGLTLPEKYLK